MFRFNQLRESTLFALSATTATALLISLSSFLVVACSQSEPTPPPADISATVAAAVAAAKPTALPPSPDIDATVKAGVQAAKEESGDQTSEPSSASDEEVVVVATQKDTTPEPAAPASTSATASETQDSTPASAEPASTSAARPASAPTPTPIPKPPGYFHGEEHGIAIYQTHREISETRSGWVDITLALFVTKFAPTGTNITSIDLESTINSLCFTNSKLPNDCGIIKWGSEEQFEAEFLNPEKITLSGAHSLQYLTFEVAQNATNASLLFGEHRIPIDLSGDPLAREQLSKPLPAPTPETESSPATAGYFMGDTYGIAITRVNSSNRGYASSVTVDIDMISTSFEPDEVDTVIRYQHTAQGVCFGEVRDAECVELYLGENDNYRLPIGIHAEDLEDLVRNWNGVKEQRLRGNAKPLSLVFGVPSNVTEVRLKFGDHLIPIDTRGMEGSSPEYAYASFYPELTPDTVLLDSNGKKMVLSSVEQVESDGSMILKFDAINDTEASDFNPSMKLQVYTVSKSGIVVYEEYTSSGEEKLGPGQQADIDVNVSRNPKANNPGDRLTYSSSELFIPVSEYVKNEADRVDGAIVMVTVTDLATALTLTTAPSYLTYDPIATSNIFNDQTRGKMLWRYYTVGDVGSSPTLSDGIIYVGTEDDNHVRRGYVYALAAPTGELVWRYETTGGHVSSSPAVSGGVVYVGSDDDNVYALDASSGELVWSYETGGDVESSPVVSGGIVYVGSNDDNVYALEASSGELVWSYETGGSVSSSPAVSGGVVYVGSHDDSVYALDASSGELVWRYVTYDSVYSSPVVSGGVVYVGSNDWSVYALDALSGELVRRYDTRGDVESSPAVSGGIVYVVSTANDNAYALNASSGELVWRASPGGVSSPVVSGGVVYIGSEDYDVHALDALSGEWVWRYDTKGRVESSPTVSGGVVYVGSNDNNVYAIIK